MDSKQKKMPAKKIGKKQFKNYAMLDGVSVSDMTKEQLESHVYQLQQEVEKEREERNYYQLERDKIQLFWEVTKQQLEEKDSVLQLKNSEIDDAALAHLAEIKLYKQKMKHIMFECQQHISEKMKEKMSEKLILEEEHQTKVKHLEKEIDRLQDKISQLNVNHEMDITNQRLQHGEELILVHEEYQKQIDDIKTKEAMEMGTIRDELDLQRREAIQNIECEKDAHIQHLIETHEELFQKMKNYYNDIIKNDILLIKTLKDQRKCFLRKESHHKEKLKNLQMKNHTLSETLYNLQQTQSSRRRKTDCDDKTLFSTESVIRNLKRELKKVKVENDFLFSQILRIQLERRSGGCQLLNGGPGGEKSFVHYKDVQVSIAIELDRIGKMLCLVRQADSVIIEVEVDAKAKGKQCLDKVCEVLGIIERDYMGLHYTGPHGESLWLNLRNQLRRQLPGPPPYRLQLRVKFFVPPHLILQDITRHHFYMDVRRAFVENRLRTTSSQQLFRLSALIAQIELGDLETAVGSTTALLNYPKFLPSNYLTSCSLDPERPPQLRVRWRSGGNSDSTISSNIGSEDVSVEARDEEQQQISIETNRTVMVQLSQRVLKEHSLLRGTKTPAAIYQFLKEASELEDFGMEQYFVKNRSGETLRMGVGPTGILIHDLNLHLKYSIAYASIHLATHAGRCFFLTFRNDLGDTQALGFKLENCHSASALYRAVTEKHAFYSCETVRNAVTSQYIRDLKGTIASLFNENTALGKNYVFDIQRTCREVYDHTRRVMYQMEAASKHNSKNSDSAHTSSTNELNDLMEEDCQSSSCKVIQEQLEAFHDSMLCRVCMDSDVCTVFFPCRHVTCCSTCAPLCQNCPLCRSSISETQHVYLPYTGRGISRFKEEPTSSENNNIFKTES